MAGKRLEFVNFFKKRRNFRDQGSRAKICNSHYTARGSEVPVEKFLDHKPLPTVLKGSRAKICNSHYTARGSEVPVEVPKRRNKEIGDESEPWVRRLDIPKYMDKTDKNKIPEGEDGNVPVDNWNHIGAEHQGISDRNHRYDVIEDTDDDYEEVDYGNDLINMDEEATKIRVQRRERHQMNQGLDIEEMVDTFRPLIEQNLIVRDVLPYLSFLETYDDLISIESKVAPRKAVRFLLQSIKNSKHAGKWQEFIEALKKTNYDYIVLNLRGYKYITVHYQRDYLKTLTHKIRKMLNAMELLPILYGKDVIGDIDKEEIEREDRNKGGIAAADMLLDRIPRKHPHWYLEFIDALKGIGRDDIAADLEIPEVMKKKCEQSTDTESRQRRNSTNTTTNGETENTTKETIQSSSVIDATKSDEENDDHQHAPKPPPPSDFSQGPQRPQMPLPSIPILRTSVMDANKSDADNDYYDYALPPPPPSNFSQDPGRLPMPVIPILRTSVMDANERDTEYNDYQYALQPSPPSQFSKGPQRPPIPLPRTRLPVSTISNSINKLEIDSNSSNKIALRPVLPSCRPYKCRCPPQPTPPVPHPILETLFEDLSQPASLPNRPTMQSNGTSAHQELEDEIEKLQREKDSLEKELKLMTTKDGLHEKINEELRKKKLLQISLRNKEKETEALQKALADDSTGDDYLPSSARHLSLLTAAKDIKTKVSVTWPEQSVTPYVSDPGTFWGPTSIVKLYNAKQGLSKMEIQDKTYNDSAFYSDYIPMVE